MQGTPLTFKELITNFKQWMERLGYAESTIRGNITRIRYFFTYLKKQDIQELKNIKASHIQDYQKHLDTLAIASTTLGAYLSTLRLFNTYLEQYSYDPIVTSQLKIIPNPIIERTILTQVEIQQLYKQTDESLQGYIDRTMLSIYYGCGLRAKEGLQLEINDIDFKNQLLQVKRSKTHKPRYIPLNPTTTKDIKNYLNYARPVLLKVDSQYLFVHSKGGYKEAKHFNERLQILQEQANISKKATLHILRHSIATHLLENGMALEQIRQFLGHHSLEVTQTYTHIHYENEATKTPRI